MAKKRTLFGTSGIRGKADELFTAQFCFDLGRCFAQFLDKHEQKGVIALGKDSRQSTPFIYSHLAAGLIYEGREVMDLGVVAVPAVCYAILSTEAVGSVMITGSHIDMESNGVKFFALGEEILKEQEAELDEIYNLLARRVAYRDLKMGIGETMRGFENYLELLLSLSDKPVKKIKLVVDPGNGAQTELIRSALLALRLEAEFINDDIQQPLLSRDSEEDGAFAQLQKAVVAHQADLGVGFDSDGDRVVFVDEEGRFVNGDYSGSILAKYYADDGVVVPVNVSNVVERIGKQVVRTRVGSPYVVAEMKRQGFSFGFESNGGGIWADVMLTRDGGVSLIRMLNVLKWSGKSLKELVSQLPSYYIRKQKFDCKRENNGKIIKAARSFLSPVSIDETDGVKLILDQDSWILFRPSSNAAEFRVFVQSNTPTKADQLMEDALKFAKKYAHS